MYAYIDISLCKKVGDIRAYNNFTDIPPEDYVNIETINFLNIDPLVNEEYEHKNIFNKLVNIKHIYLEESCDISKLNNLGLIKNIFNFEKLKFIGERAMKQNKTLDTWVICENKMLVVTNKNTLPDIPPNINYLHITSSEDLNLNNLPPNIEYLSFNVVNIEKTEFSNPPTNLKNLSIYLPAIDYEIFDKNKIKIPYGCTIIYDGYYVY